MIKRYLRKILRKSPGTDVFWPCDQDFENLYDEGLEKCGLAVQNNPTKRRRKFLNLEYLNFIIGSHSSDLIVAEVGVYKGVASYMMAKRILENGVAKENIRFDLFDSFEGLSQRTDMDLVSGQDLPTEGLMKGTLEKIQDNLREFDFMNYYKGWIPDCFNSTDLQDVQYSFVSIDVDLYQPVYDSLNFFYPKLTSPGVILVDDFGSPKWPGTEKAVSEFVAQSGANLVRSTIGVAAILK